MKETFSPEGLAPTPAKERHIILDVLRGLALFGIGFSIIISNADEKHGKGFHVFTTGWLFCLFLAFCI